MSVLEIDKINGKYLHRIKSSKFGFALKIARRSGVRNLKHNNYFILKHLPGF